jgi:hypothetical protein
MTRRFLAGVFLGVFVVFGSVVVTAPSDIMDGVCAALGPDSPLWDVLGCTKQNGPTGS